SASRPDPPHVGSSDEFLLITAGVDSDRSVEHSQSLGRQQFFPWSRTRLLVPLAVSLALLPPQNLVVQPASAAAVAATTSDTWSPIVMLRGAGGTYAAPVHGTVMPDGRVLLIGEERPSLT